VSEDPFGALGLPRRPGLSDDDVRAAWRRIAAATHPDRDDGGDPVVFGAAAAAYATLRTAYGRGEALADLAGGLGADRAGPHVRNRRRPRGRHGAHRGHRTPGRLRVLGLDGAHRGHRTRERRRVPGRDGARGGSGTWGRLRVPGRDGARGGSGTWGRLRVLGRDGAREARGRPGVLALRAGAAAAVCAVAFAVAGLAPATIGVLAGSLTWLIATGRHDLP
jgi:hypothetical protein